MENASCSRTVLEEVDVRAMVRLLGEVAALPGDHLAKKRFLMGGLCDLIGADSWGWTFVYDFSPGEVPKYAAFLHGGFTEEKFAKFLEATEHPDVAALNAAMTREYEQKHIHLTRLREEIDVNNFFPKSDAYPLWCAANIDAVIMSVRPVSNGRQTCIGIFRSVGRPKFTHRESRIAHIILSEVPWLHEAGWPGEDTATVPKLSPRQRITLNLLLEGQSRKEIADHLGISINTVAGYAKDVYRHFHVQSHAELMRHFFHGDGGDLR